MYIIFSDLDWGVVLVLISIFMVIIFLNESLILVRFIVNMVGIIVNIKNKINDYLYLKKFYLWIELCMYIFVIILVCLSYYIYVLVLVICVDDM